jgi:hypothetical protein
MTPAKNQPKRRWKLVLLGLLVVGVPVGVMMVNPRKGYAPKQPIFFEHSKMAAKPRWVKDKSGKLVNQGGYDIPCRYCHTMPYKGRHSTLPSTQICMNCHSTVGQDKEWVLVLKDYYERSEPIPWVKVHDLPDFVYYDHSAHLNAHDAKGKAKLDCVDCHGEVENHSVVAVQHKLTMGWCLECHQKPEMAAPFDCVVCHR